MKQKRILLILVVAFVLLIGGASVLYTQLADEYTPTDRLLTPASQSDQSETKQPESSALPEGGMELENENGDSSLELPHQEEKERNEPKAADFTVVDAQGDPVRLSDYLGKPIVLNFWASWCGPCQMEMPEFQEKYLLLGEEVHFLMVNMTVGRETVTTAKQFVAQNEYSFPVLFDTDAGAAASYRVYSLPTTYFIDAEGYIIAQSIGAIDGETLQRGIDMIR